VVDNPCSTGRPRPAPSSLRPSRTPSPRRRDRDAVERPRRRALPALAGHLPRRTTGRCPHPGQPTPDGPPLQRQPRDPGEAGRGALRRGPRLPARCAGRELIEKRLGRQLQPFDIWYSGFRPRGRFTEAELDAITKKRYPNPAAYAADMRASSRAGLLRGARPLPRRPYRGRSARAPATPSAPPAATTRPTCATRVGEDGMDYKGYNIAVHEMGHNVEQVFSVTTIDHTLLQGSRTRRSPRRWPSCSRLGTSSCWASPAPTPTPRRCACSTRSG